MPKNKDIPDVGIEPEEAAQSTLEGAITDLHRAIGVWRAADAAYGYLTNVEEGVNPAPMLKYVVRGPEGEPLDAEFNLDALEDEETKGSMVTLLLLDAFDDYVKSLSDIVNASQIAQKRLHKLLDDQEED